MKLQSNEQLGQAKKLSDLAYEPIRDISHLSPYHQRVTMQKKYIERKQKLRSILIMGHLKKMELNAINNRSIATMRKSKLAQQMSRKRYCSVEQQNEDVIDTKALKIDNRKKLKEKIKTQISQNNLYESNQLSQRKDVSNEQPERVQQLIYEKLIDDYLKQVTKQKLLQQGMDRKQIIEQACNVIRQQMINNGLIDKKKYKINTQPNSSMKQIINNDNRKKKNKQKRQYKKSSLIIFSQKNRISSSQRLIHLPVIKQIKQLPLSFSINKKDSKINYHNNNNNSRLEANINNSKVDINNSNKLGVNKSKNDRQYRQNRSYRLLSISTRNDNKSIQRSNRYDKNILKEKNSPINKSLLMDIQCNENLKKLQLQQNYLSKQRIRDEKLFLRKIKLIGMKNVRTLRSSLNQFL